MADRAFWWIDEGKPLHHLPVMAAWMCAQWILVNLPQFAFKKSGGLVILVENLDLLILVHHGYWETLVDELVAD